MADRVSVIIDLGTPSASLGKRLISSRFLPMLLVICFGIPVTKFSMTIFPLMLSHLPSKLKKVALEHLSAWRSKTSSPAAHHWKPQSPSSQCVQDKLSLLFGKIFPCKQCLLRLFWANYSSPILLEASLRPQHRRTFSSPSSFSHGCITQPFSLSSWKVILSLLLLLSTNRISPLTGEFLPSSRTHSSPYLPHPIEKPGTFREVRTSALTKWQNGPPLDATLDAFLSPPSSISPSSSTVGKIPIAFVCWLFFFVFFLTKRKKEIYQVEVFLQPAFF